MTDQIQYSNPLTPFVTAVLGGESDTDIAESSTTDKTGSTTSSGSTKSNTSGTNSAITSGTNKNTTSGTNSNTTSGTNSNTTSGNTTQTTNADISALQSVFAKQSAGITPEMLTAIFTQGVKQVPGLQTAYGNAVGARASDNTPLATNIRDLQGTLTNQAAMLNNQLLKDSGVTAAQIAELTKSITGTNNSTTSGVNNSTTSGVNNSTTTGVNNSTTTGANNSTTNSLQDQTVNTTDKTNTTGSKAIDAKNTVNTDALKVLGGLGIGGSILDWGLGGNGATGGLTNLLGKVTGVVPGALGSIGNLFNNGVPSQDLTGMWDGLFGANSLQKDLDSFGIDWTGNFDDLFSGAGSAIDSTFADSFTDSFTDSFDWGSLLDNAGSIFGWADGGRIDAQRSTATANPQAKQQFMQKLMMLQQLARHPQGRKLLQAKMEQRKAANAGAGPGAGTGPGAGAGQDSGVGHASTVSNSQATPEGIAAMSMAMQGIQSTALSAALGPIGQAIGLSGIPGMVAAMLGKSALSNAINAPQASAASTAADGGGPADGTAGVGVGEGGIGSSGAGTAAGDAAGNSEGSGGAADGSGSAGGTGGSSGAASAWQDGGRVHREGDPIVGTKGPQRKGSGSGAMSEESVAAATRKSQSAENTSKAPENATRRGNGLSFQTNKMLKEIDNYAEGGEVEGGMWDEMNDPEGIEDTVTGQLSVGEYVVPRDVVDTLGVDFFEQLKARYHTPADLQRAMGL